MYSVFLVAIVLFQDIVHYLLHTSLASAEDGTTVAISSPATALSCSLASPVLTAKTQLQFVTMLEQSLRRLLMRPESPSRHRLLQAFCKHLHAIMVHIYPKLEAATKCAPGTPLDPVVGMILQAGILNHLATIPSCIDLSSRLLSNTMSELLIPMHWLASIACAYCVPYNDLEKAMTARLHGVEAIAKGYSQDRSTTARAYGIPEGTASADAVEIDRLDTLLRRIVQSSTSAGQALELLVDRANRANRAGSRMPARIRARLMAAHHMAEFERNPRATMRVSPTGVSFFA